jgi:two-component system nitrate/nitrite response regulator NarL
MEPEDRQVRILLVDPRPWTRMALASGIELAGRDFEVFPFAHVSELHGAEAPAIPTIVLINASGEDLAEVGPLTDMLKAGSGRADSPVVLLSDHNDANEIVGMLKQGLRGFIPISMELPLALDALRFVAAGGTFVPAELMLSFAEVPPDPDAGERDRTDGDGTRSKGEAAPESKLLSPLTPRERSVLQCLGEGHSNKQIARQLDIAEATVKVHVRHLISKLGMANRTQVALLAAKLRKRVA